MNTFAIAVSTWKVEEKLPKDDDRWGKFNASFRNHWVEPMEFADLVMTGHAYTSWHDPMYRHSDNWQLSQYLAVDMDTEDERSSLKVLAEHDFIMAFATLIHTTPSHTRDKPRARVVFFLDRPIVNPRAYANAARFLNSFFGGDTVTHDPSRFFYGNIKAEIEMLRGRLPVDYLYNLYQRDKARQAEIAAQGENKQNDRHTTASHRSHNSGQRSSSQGPKRGRYDDVKELLGRIDPWGMEYIKWVACIAAIKHELGDDGLSLAVQWAKGNPNEVERMWKSMRRDDNANVATFGTLCQLAYPGR